MSTQTCTEVSPAQAGSEDHELQMIGSRSSNRRPTHTNSNSNINSNDDPQPLDPTEQHVSKIPKLKLLTAGFSFFCAGVDGSTLGPLIPYILRSFTIGTGEVAIM